MLCPCCKSEIIIGSEKRYQTLDEHVCSPNDDSPMRLTLICSEPSCITRGHDVFWDADGDMYGGFTIPDFTFIGGNNSPFNSLARRLNIEIYKVGVKDKTELSPAWLLGFYQPIIQWEYQANENGEVLKRSFSIRYLKKAGGKKYSVYVTPFWETARFLWDRFKRSRDNYRKTKSQFALEQMFKEANNRAWVYRTFEKLVQLRYRKYFNEYTKLV